MTGRSRAFNAVFYPESVPDGFRDLIDSWQVPALLVLHDRDEEKKAHYHLLLSFGSLKSMGQIHELTDQLGSRTVQPAHDLHASARYLLHLDHPAKFQYPVECLESFSGASVSDLLSPVSDPSDEMLAWVRDQGIVEYSALVNYCQDLRPDWSRHARSHTIFWRGYLGSVRHARESESKGRSYDNA